MQLDYPVDLVRDEDMYVAAYPDLPGCVSMGSNPSEAINNLDEVKSLWIEGRLAAGYTINEPPRAEEYSGKFVLRVPKQLHKMAERRARLEGVSLNSYITSVLAGAIGYARPDLNESTINVDAGESVFHWMHLWDLAEGQQFSITRAAPEPTAAKVFARVFADQLRNHNKTIWQPQELEDYHSAKDEKTALSCASR
jgi:predicted RNase H-like HicB family nuclease